MASTRASILEELLSEVIRLGADALEVEYDEGIDEVTAIKGDVGVGIADLRRPSPEARSLSRELHALGKRKRRMTIEGSEYEVQGRCYESFGEEAFHVDVRPVERAARRRRAGGRGVSG